VVGPTQDPWVFVLLRVASQAASLSWISILIVGTVVKVLHVALDSG
jgi:hypothetical protein